MRAAEGVWVDDDEEVLVGVVKLFDAAVLVAEGTANVAASDFPDGADVILYTLIYHVPPQIWALFPLQGIPHQYSSTRSGSAWAKLLPQ